MANNGWNGSTLSLGGGVTPLTELHQPDDPVEYETTGSTDGTHTKGTGLHKNSFTASLLGSKCPIAGTCLAITAAIGASGNQTTKTYSQAIITQMSITGRKDGPIESSITAMPGDTSLSATTNTWTPGADLGFNGSTCSWAGTALSNILSATYSSSVTPIESVGANTATADNLYVPGIPEESLVITVIGNPALAAKAVGATVMAWKDGGSLGSWSNAKLVSVHPGGTLDGQVTTELTFKPSLSTTDASG